MEPFYEQENSNDSHECRAARSPSSSFFPEEETGQTRRRQQHRRLRHHRSQRSAKQLYRQDSSLRYAQRYEFSASARRPRHRCNSSLSLSANSSHSRRSHPSDVHDDNDDYFRSDGSILPALDVTALMRTDPNFEVPGTNVETVLTEEFPVSTWPQGSQLLERRIQQAVDQETVELEELHESVEGNGGGRLSWGGGTAADAGSTAVASRWPLGPPPLSPIRNPSPSQHDNATIATAGASTSSLASPLSAPVGPRIKAAELLADPRNRLLNLVITNTSASVTLGEIEQTMQWKARYEPMYGELLEYLQSYQSIFVVSPVDDRVRLRRLFSIRTSQQHQLHQQKRRHTSRSRLSRPGGREAAMQRSSSAVDRRSGKPSLPSAEALAAHIGSISYSCVAEHLNLDILETVYRRRGYDTAVMHSVLHVTSDDDFHLFLFPSGSVVWWGMNRTNHWMVEDDFLSEAMHLKEGLEHRYPQSEIEALFPIWCSYEIDEQCDKMQVVSPLGIQPSAVKPALERLSKVLCFDHYLVPVNEPARSLVMLTFSHSLGSSARVDYFEYVTKWSHRHILSIPAEFSGLFDYFSTKQRVKKLEGEIAVAQLAIQSIHDTPEVLWEVPWLQAYYDLAEQQNTSQSRLSWFSTRSDTLLEQLSHIKARRHRLFMLGSDVFLIVLLILDVMFMTSRLVAKMYFKVEEDE